MTNQHKVDAHLAAAEAASPIHWAGNDKADDEAAMAAHLHDLTNSVVKVIQKGDQRTWAIQSRLIACLMLQPKQTYEKDKPDSHNNTPQQQLINDGHVLQPLGRRHVCLQRGQKWNYQDINIAATQRQPCPGHHGIWRQMKPRPWKVLAPQVWVGARSTHPSHQGMLYWFMGCLFCIRGGHFLGTGNKRGHSGTGDVV